MKCGRVVMSSSAGRLLLCDNHEILLNTDPFVRSPIINPVGTPSCPFSSLLEACAKNATDRSISWLRCGLG